MMALKEGCQYGLLSNDSTIRANLSCAHVKLTDAAAKVIEDYHLKNVINTHKNIHSFLTWILLSHVDILLLIFTLIRFNN